MMVDDNPWARAWREEMSKRREERWGEPGHIYTETPEGDPIAPYCKTGDYQWAKMVLHPEEGKIGGLTCIDCMELFLKVDRDKSWHYQRLFHKRLESLIRKEVLSND